MTPEPTLEQIEARAAALCARWCTGCPTSHDWTAAARTQLRQEAGLSDIDDHGRRKR